MSEQFNALLGGDQMSLPWYDYRYDPDYHLQAEAFRIYSRRLDPNKPKPCLDGMFFAFLCLYFKDALPYLSRMLFNMGYSSMALARVNKKFYAITKDIVTQYEIRRMIMNERVWTMKVRPDEQGQYAPFTLRTDKLYGQMRRLYKLPSNFEMVSGVSLEVFMMQHLSPHLSFLPKGWINLQLFPEGAWEIEVKPKNKRAKKNKSKKKNLLNNMQEEDEDRIQSIIQERLVAAEEENMRLRSLLATQQVHQDDESGSFQGSLNMLEEEILIREEDLIIRFDGEEDEVVMSSPEEKKRKNSPNSQNQQSKRKSQNHHPYK
eukprot:TRINITY_DN2972_c0_g1_i4.p1 TRINITY_DN2972_c0_g1~~TRINITY_DN2972_c0_g1_i4.p1  ORF type:complete len:318 (-),score=77.05 TRINITY_DN2972_c0_g1_i4:31-984(-)